MRQTKTQRLNDIRILAAAIALAIALGADTAAQLASRPVDDWLKVLDTKERLAGLRIDEVVAKLALKPGDIVADLGAGAGPFVVSFAKAVSAKGKVYAVEVDRDFFPYIQKRATAAGVDNVEIVLGEFTDPKLPGTDVDVAFLHDVLHHVENRSAYLNAVTKYVKPGGRIAIIDYHPAQSPQRSAWTSGVERTGQRLAERSRVQTDRGRVALLRQMVRRVRGAELTDG